MPFRRRQSKGALSICGTRNAVRTFPQFSLAVSLLIEVVLRCPPTLGRPEPGFSGCMAQGAEAADEPFMSDIGGLLPIALCGRTVLSSLRPSSIFERASSSVRNQWALRHSFRNLPSKDSRNALSGGLAGPGEVQVDTALVGPQVEITRDELAALIDPDRLRIADGPAGSLKRCYDILSSVAEPRIDHGREA